MTGIPGEGSRSYKGCGRDRDKDVEEVLDRCPFDPFVPFVLSSLDKDVPFPVPAQVHMDILPAYFCSCKIRM